MLRLRSHLLWMEWTLPRCSKNTGQLVAPSTKQGRLMSRRGNIFIGDLGFTSQVRLHFNVKLLTGGGGAFHKVLVFRVQEIFSLVTKLFISLANVIGAQCVPWLMSIYIWKIYQMSQWHNFHPFLCQSKRLRWWFQCHQKLIYLIQSLTNQTSEWPGYWPITGCYEEVTWWRCDNCQLSVFLL